MLQATFRQLQTFVIVAETGSFAATAAKLGVSSAAVSGLIAALERKLNCKLFVRQLGTTSLLSDMGAAVLQQTRGLLDKATLVADLAGVAAKPQLKAKVGAGGFILNLTFLPHISTFQLEHLDVQIELVQIAEEAVADAVRSGQLDLAYVAMRTDPTEPWAELIGVAQPGLFISPDHPMARQWRNDGTTTLPMIMPLSGSPLERITLSLLADAGLSNYVATSRAQHTATVYKLTLQGAGACWLFREDAANAVQSGKLIELDADFPAFRRWAFRRPGALKIDHLRRLDAFLMGLLQTRSPLDAGEDLTAPLGIG